MEERIEPEKEVRRSRRRFWWSFAGVLAFALAVIGYVMCLYDVAPPDDAWLLPAPFPPATGPHSMPEFQLRAGALMEQASKDFMRIPLDVRMVEPGSVAKSRAFLDEHSAALKEMNDFMAANQGPLPFPGGDKGLVASLVPDHSSVSTLQLGTLLVTLEARTLVREGRLRESLDRSLGLLRLGHQLTQKNADLIQWLSGEGIQRSACVALESTAKHQPFAEEDLKRVEAALNASEISPHSFQSTMQVEYLNFKAALPILRHNAFTAAPISMSAAGLPMWAGPTLKVNMTLTRLLDLERPVFTACDVDWRQMVSAGEVMAQSLPDDEDQSLKHYLSANLGGDAWLGSDLYVWKHVFERGARVAAWHRQMVLMVALRRFELEHGTLPAKLDELCPKYLVKIPPDPFDNQPMRWNAKTRAIYSVNSDLKDDGGSFSKPGESTTHDKDVGLIYWWATPSK